MPRLPHGYVPRLTPASAREDLARRTSDMPLAFAAAVPTDSRDFDFMFPSLQYDEANLLPAAPETPERLKALGRAMHDPGDATDPGDAQLPAVYTYLGQFLDHDITLEVQPADVPPEESTSVGALLDSEMTPLPVTHIGRVLQNLRSATLDLDSVYGLPAPHDPANSAKLLVGTNFPITQEGSGPPFTPVPGKDLSHDLPREPESPDPLRDRAAIIGDPRNDENLIVAQLHVAFLKAHNALVDQGRTFEAARRLLREHYQYVVIHDFLKRVADPAIVDDVVRNGNRWFNPAAEPSFMPLEFSVAAYRFGHSLVRDTYGFNVNFRPATLDQLFTFTALSGPLGGLPTVPDNWIIEWEGFVENGSAARNRARKFDTKLAEGLFSLRNLVGDPESVPTDPEGDPIPDPADAARLAVRNLLRGYRLRLPTGQAVAGLLGVPVLTPAEIEAAAASPAQVQALRDGGFLERTPLWYYIFAEAKAGGGERLGPVGSTIVAEVLVGLVRRSEDSILRTPGWLPSLTSGPPTEFQLADLLRLAGVLTNGRPLPVTYVVQDGDTLSGIARNQLGDTGRWPEIFALNRSVVRHPDRIFPGQVLVLPSPGQQVPVPRVHIVRPGDTLSGIARDELGDAGRWPEIFALNRDVVVNPDRIFPGQVLVLPDA